MSTKHTVTNAASAKPLSRGQPMRLKIPKIHVDAAVDKMGITSDGDMAAPSGPKTVGWYKHGPYPGNVGSAVIDGHFGRWANGQGSVFDNLNQLKRGDLLYVLDIKGATSTFVVQRLLRFTPNADDVAVFRSSDGQAHLNLITCEGVWSVSKKSYSGRLVVFADKSRL